MEEYLKKLSKEIRDLIYLARDTAAKNGMSVYLVGGFVRDLILGVKNLDLDIVVEGNGIQFAEVFAKGLNSRLIRHRRFGTATVMINPKMKVDIATARKEFYPKPAQLPEVTGGSLKDDLFRRDFTINAMAISINTGDFGRLIDIFNGEKDLGNKYIRVLHSLSFIDDPTRILRAIRFEKRYDFKIESGTLKLLKEAVKERILEKVSPQRLRDELILVLKEDEPLKYIKRVKDLAGLDFISPGLSVFKKTYSLLDTIKKEIGWFEKHYPSRRQIDAWLIYLMGIIDTLNINEVRVLFRKFVFLKGEEKRILSYKKIALRFIRQLCGKKIRPSRIFDLLEPLSYEVIILLRAKYKNPVLKRHIADFFSNYNGMRICVSGDDLHRLGVAPGPYYQKIFTQVLKAKLEGQLRTKEEELALIRKLIKNK
jgi:tRNA nucleotidyltransferase (CCA-adding enzyme)